MSDNLIKLESSLHLKKFKEKKKTRFQVVQLVWASSWKLNFSESSPVQDGRD